MGVGEKLGMHVACTVIGVFGYILYFLPLSGKSPFTCAFDDRLLVIQAVNYTIKGS